MSQNLVYVVSNTDTYVLVRTYCMYVHRRIIIFFPPQPFVYKHCMLCVTQHLAPIMKVEARELSHLADLLNG